MEWNYTVSDSDKYLYMYLTDDFFYDLNNPTNKPFSFRQNQRKLD